MTDEMREKVIKGLEWCLFKTGCNGCPYRNDCDGGINMEKDALTLLKAQEPRVMTVRKQPTIDAIPVAWLREKIDGYASRLRSRELDSLVMVLTMWEKEQEAR